jgi:hypothetical protein
VSSRGGIYAALALIGLIVPGVLLVKFFIANGLDFGLLWEEATGTLVAKALLADLTISSIVFWVWMAREAPRHGITWWPYVIVNLLLGLCVALPLFLMQRERRSAGAATAPA